MTDDAQQRLGKRVTGGTERQQVSPSLFFATALVVIFVGVRAASSLVLPSSKAPEQGKVRRSGRGVQFAATVLGLGLADSLRMPPT